MIARIAEWNSAMEMRFAEKKKNTKIFSDDHLHGNGGDRDGNGP